MNVAKSLRAKYGFTQQVAAGLLGISHSHLALIETDKRSLPAKAWETIEQLHAAADEPIKQKRKVKSNSEYVSFMKDQYMLQLTDLQKYQGDCSYRQEKIRRKLAPLEMKRNSAVLALKLLLNMRLTQSLNKVQVMSIRKAESDAKKTLNLIPQIALDKLTFELEALAYIESKVEEKINRLDDLVNNL